MTTEWMNTKEVAQYLGIHEKQVYPLIKARRLPSTRVLLDLQLRRHGISVRKIVGYETEVYTHFEEDRMVHWKGWVFAFGGLLISSMI